jgi:hypothetical protein
VVRIRLRDRSGGLGLVAEGRDEAAVVCVRNQDEGLLGTGLGAAGRIERILAAIAGDLLEQRLVDVQRGVRVTPAGDEQRRDSFDGFEVGLQGDGEHAAAGHAHDRLHTRLGRDAPRRACSARGREAAEGAARVAHDAHARQVGAGSEPIRQFIQDLRNVPGAVGHSERDRVARPRARGGQTVVAREPLARRELGVDEVDAHVLLGIGDVRRRGHHESGGGDPLEQVRVIDRIVHRVAGRMRGQIV